MGALKNSVAAGLLLISATANATANQVFHGSDTLSSKKANAGVDVYNLYSGDGSSGNGWPTADKWVSFDSMWEANKALMSNGCAWFAQSVAENSPSETEEIKTNILEAAQYTQVDPRFILAVTMQESRGCVRVKTTVGSHQNPGLMQSHEGDHSCFSLAPGQACSAKTISGMIMDGTSGTVAGDGLAAILQQQVALGYSGAQLYYRAARVYNSGSVAADDVLEHGIATHCYVSNIANRLTGWAANTKSYCCPFDSGAASQCDAAPVQASTPGSTAVPPTSSHTSAQSSGSASTSSTSSSISESSYDSATSTWPALSASLTTNSLQPTSFKPTIFTTATRSASSWMYGSSSFITKTSCTNSSTVASFTAISTTTISLGYGTTGINASDSSFSFPSNGTLPVVTRTVLPLPLTLNGTASDQTLLSTAPHTTTVNATTTMITTVLLTTTPRVTSASFNASDIIWPTVTHSTRTSNATSSATVVSTSSIDWGQLSSLLSPEMSTVTVTLDACSSAPAS